MKIIYTCTPPPDMRNIGDQAQAVCILRWFAKHWPGVEVLEFHKKVPIAEIAARTEPDDLVFIHSGGNMCNRGMGLSEPARRAVVKALPDNKIISLPQTIGFSGMAERGAEEVYNGHRDLLIIGRDPISYSYALDHFPKADAWLCPDFVLGHAEGPSMRNGRDGVLLCLRSDGESVLGKEGRARLAEELKEPYGAVLGDTNASRNVPPERREIELDTMLVRFASYQAVVTDRLHGVIFSILAGTPVVVLPTVDHKLTASWWWFRVMPQVLFLRPHWPPPPLPLPKAEAWVRQVYGLPQTLDQALACEDFEDMDWAGDWHDRLPGLIAERESAITFKALVAARHTHRRWLDVPVARSLLVHLVGAGVRAPSGSNAQCVRFRIVSEPAEVREWYEVKRPNSAQANGPAAIILVGYDYGVPGTINYQHRSDRWGPLAYQDVAAAMENMLLAAESVGLAGCWVSLFDKKVSQGAVEWISALYVGWPESPWNLEQAHQGRPVARQPLEHYLV